MLAYTDTFGKEKFRYASLATGKIHVLQITHIIWYRATITYKSTRHSIHKPLAKIRYL